MDIHCAKCGEPWDSYGVHHGDLTPAESRRFLRGEGCPSCNFGTTCTQCGGSGKERDAGSRCYCRGEYYIFARVLDYDNDNQARCFRGKFDLMATIGKSISDRYILQYDWVPNVKTISDAERAKAVLMRVCEPMKECRDGWFYEVKLACPFCDVTKAMPCTTCNGTGKLVTGHEDKQELFQVVGQLLGGDQDGATAMLEDMS